MPADFSQPVWQDVFPERLSAEAGMDGHDEDHVDFVQVGLEFFWRRIGVEAYAFLAAQFGNRFKCLFDRG